MSQDEEQQRHSRVVVETPTARREVVQTRTTRYAEPERTGYSTGMIAAVALTAIAATAIVFLFLMNRDDSKETNVNVRTAATQPTPLAQQPVMVQQPVPQPTVIIQQVPVPATSQPAPVIIQAPPPATTDTTATTRPAPATGGSASSAPSATDDLTLESNVNKAFTDDPEVSVADVDVRVVNAKVLLMGTVKSADLKSRAEKLAYQVKGVRSVENKISVSPE